MIVEVDDAGLPIALIRRGHRFIVTKIQEVWRIEDEWWREPISRRYYLLVLEQSSLCTVYQDLISRDWYEHYA